ncbi:hypothetical protein GFS24_17615 [Chitinophaga sp. SYP-B3965]|uniref:type IV toxin-antitoxin system AbiEi family antitoxin n=1 Tax=Chitinophaga sp. SYP-B3965 TaxID=2663120 RepID=UPI001299DE83|nr:type IV toxin-antitoxin system AbiEi family antitoxin [Chitinophaga sp. SYP-B3965]MRG46944.1 hypothetical protein [Chitinophaga sp. SYP-B3965]
MNNNETYILEKALARLGELTGIQVTDIRNVPNGSIDFKIKLERKNHWHLELSVETRTEFKPYHLPRMMEMARQNTPFMLVAERIYPAQKQALKENGINYLDTAGNIFLSHDQIYLFVEGNKPVDEIKPVTNRAFTKGGLKTAFHFLLDEQFLNMPYRTLAQTTGVSLGSINYIMEGLDQAGFILPVDNQTKKLQQKKLLLERWITAYHETLKPSLFMGSFLFKGRDLSEPGEKENVWGGEPAAEMLINHLFPQIYTVYTLKDKLGLMKSWKLIPKNEGDLKVYQKFWTAPEWDAKQLAPPLLIYADLLETNDPRCIEAAGIIYNQFLKNEFE